MGSRLILNLSHAFHQTEFHKPGPRFSIACPPIRISDVVPSSTPPSSTPFREVASLILVHSPYSPIGINKLGSMSMELEDEL